jgi:hypothetical protein
MKNYYTYNESTKQLTPVKRILVRDGKTMILGNPADFAKYLNAYPRGADTPPACYEGYRAVPNGYDLKDGKWVKLWKVEPIVYTVEDYDNAMEDYIHQVAVDRGYTRREPSDYKDDPCPRFAQDAEDFIAFRSSVMLYALPILNEYTKTGNAPTIAEFKANFPKMVWTYQEEV